MAKIKALFLLLILTLLILPGQIVLADTGPKPSMEFEFKGRQERELLILSGVLYECEQSDCGDAKPLEELGPQRLTCDVMSCHATAYGFAPYHILEVGFSDGVTRRTSVFETAGFASKYTVTVQPDDLLIKAQLSLGAVSPRILFFVALACACNGMALVIGLIIFLIIRFAKKSD